MRDSLTLIWIIILDMDSTEQIVHVAMVTSRTLKVRTILLYDQTLFIVIYFVNYTLSDETNLTVVSLYVLSLGGCAPQSCLNLTGS